MGSGTRSQAAAAMSLATQLAAAGTPGLKVGLKVGYKMQSGSGLCPHPPCWRVDARQCGLQQLAHRQCMVHTGEDDTRRGMQQHHERAVVQQLQQQETQQGQEVALGLDMSAIVWGKESNAYGQLLNSAKP